METFEQALDEVVGAARAGQRAKARAGAERLCEKWPGQAEGWLWRAWLCEDPVEALRCTRQAAQRSPGPLTEEAVRWAQAWLDEPPPPSPAPPRDTAPPPAAAPDDAQAAGRLLAGTLLALLALLALWWGVAPKLVASNAPVVLSDGVADTGAAALGATLSATPSPTPPPQASQVEPALAAPTAEALLPPSNPLTMTETLPTPVDMTSVVVAAINQGVALASEPPDANGTIPTPVAAPGDDPRLTDVQAPDVAPPIVAATPNVTPGPVDSPYALWPARDYPVLYRVRAGDNITAIAQRFGLQPLSIVWANEGSGNPELLSIDQELLIPPLDGVLHTAQPGDTVSKLAADYGVDPALIAWFSGNGLSSPDDPLQPGQRVMVPGGRKAMASLPPAPAAPAARGGASYFGWPTTGSITTTYSPYHTGIDIAAAMNTPIFAAQSGEVIFTGWDNRGYGYAIVIDHHNGWYTRYAHLSGMYPAVGDWVNRGDLIALMGSTGRSTGPHLHFEIITNGYKYNPFDYLPR